jgi:hypothetical protein
MGSLFTTVAQQADRDSILLTHVPPPRALLSMDPCPFCGQMAQGCCQQPIIKVNVGPGVSPRFTYVVETLRTIWVVYEFVKSIIAWLG